MPSPVRTVRVELGARGYDVVIGARSIDAMDAHVRAAGLANAGGFALVADRATGEAVGRTAQALRRLEHPVHEFVLDVAESSKSMHALDELYAGFIEAKLDRSCVVVALGGGVVGDLAGFAAATFLRGVRWVGVPTTLLAAVDSSVGGKTGINHARGKNLIGAIHQPSLVVVDPTVFATLPRREHVSGYGEMLKYGLALDRALWDELVETPAHAVTEAQIERCIALKAEIVAADERDETGTRETLNFGHTIGHAIESVTSYAVYRHGEAVVLGMRAAVALSATRGHCSRELATSIDARLAAVPVPPLPDLDPRLIVEAVGRDKKRAAGGPTRFVLLREIGQTVADGGVDRAAVHDAFLALETACASRS